MDVAKKLRSYFGKDYVDGNKIFYDITEPFSPEFLNKEQKRFIDIINYINERGV